MQEGQDGGSTPVSSSDNPGIIIFSPNLVLDAATKTKILSTGIPFVCLSNVRDLPGEVSRLANGRRFIVTAVADHEELGQLVDSIDRHNPILHVILVGPLGDETVTLADIFEACKQT